MQKKDQELKIQYLWRSDSNPDSDSKNAQWKSYDDEDITVIEEGYQKYSANNIYKEVNLKKAANYKVDFSSWIQSCVNDFNRQRPFKREISILEIKKPKDENPQFFWRSDKDPFSKEEIAEWTPYDSEESKFLETSYQKYLSGQGPNVVKLGDKYNVDFKYMMQIHILDTKRQRPVKREQTLKPKTNKKYFCSSKTCKSNKIFSDDSFCNEHPNSYMEIPKFLVNLFEFKKKLGSGAFGFVFQVYDIEDQEIKALKLLKIEDFEDGDVTVLKKLQHPNIIRYFRSKAFSNDFGFVLMEFCDSELNSLIKENQISFEDKLKIFKQICKGIKYFHSVIHSL